MSDQIQTAGGSLSGTGVDQPTDGGSTDPGPVDGDGKGISSVSDGSGGSSTDGKGISSSPDGKGIS
jgi:hypothetical protein